MSCTRAEPHASPTAPPTEKSARKEVAVTAASRLVSWKIGGEPQLCFFASDRGAFCASPNETSAGITLAPRRYAAEGVMEVGRHGCVRTNANVQCGDRVFSGIESAEGYPYLVAADGSVTVAENGDGDEVHALRSRAVRALPPIKRVVATDFHACALTRDDGAVYCWVESRFWFNDAVEKPVEPKPTKLRVAARVRDLLVAPWLSVCVLTEDQSVSCNTPPPTDACVLRGAREVLCGVGKTHVGAETVLKAPTYDPRAIFNLPLTSVGVSSATSLHAYRRLLYSEHNATRSMDLADFAEGGCATRADKKVQCWSRELCQPGQPWRAALVEGLPATTDIALGGDDGYAIVAGGLYQWTRDAAPCSSDGPKVQRPLTARLHPLPRPATAVGGGVFAAERVKAFIGVDCAAMDDNSFRCWTSGASGGRDVPVARFE